MFGVPCTPIIHEVHVTTLVTTNWLLTVGTVVGGTIAGAVAGFVAGHDRSSSKPRPLDGPHFDPVDEERINQAATEWAANHGRTGSEGLVAQKLRLLRELQQERRWRRGWPQ